MNELQAILDKSTAPEAVKQQALKLAFEIAAPIAYQATRGQANAFGDGTFLALLMELLKMLLPILLQLLVPTTV